MSVYNIDINKRTYGGITTPVETGWDPSFVHIAEEEYNRSHGIPTPFRQDWILDSNHIKPIQVDETKISWWKVRALSKGNNGRLGLEALLFCMEFRDSADPRTAYDNWGRKKMDRV